MFEDEIEELGKIYRMPPNWDNHGSRTIGFNAIMRAMQLVTMIFCEFAERPYLMYPTRAAGVALEYQTKDGASIEIEIYDDKEVFAYLIDLGEAEREASRWLIEDNVPMEKLYLTLCRVFVHPSIRLDEKLEERMLLSPNEFKKEGFTYAKHD